MKRRWLKDIRRNLKLTQKDVAKKLAISRSHYACIENGIKNPSIELAGKLSDLMNFDFGRFKSDLLKETSHFKNTSKGNDFNGI